GVPTLNRNDAHGYKLVIPTTEAEQTAIATILSDMDAEIQALEQRLSKTRQIKQSMMQELLTGKTRLIKGEAHG
ncbi:restriction endonuclease subunit S, partial [Klebsiella pneumoniae]|nr:restriction endonuclease subunit S [Klebsiella pneumoniae]